MLYFLYIIVNYSHQILAVLVLGHGGGEVPELFGGDPAVFVGDFFQAGYLEAGALFQGFYEDGGVGQGIVGAGVQPGEASAKDLNFEFAVFEEFLVHGGDFQFSSGAGFDVFGNINYLVGVEVEAHHSVVALGLLRLFFNAEAVALFVKFGHAVTLGVRYPVTEDGGFLVFLGIFYCLAEKAGEAAAVEYIVSQNQASAVVSYELLANDEGLRQAVGAGLFGILKVYAIVGAVSQQALEAREVIGGGDDKDVPDARQH